MGRAESVRPIFYNETFEKLCPYYMSIGMTYDEYWNGDCLLVRYYREADELKRRRKNEESWMMGMYVYDALARISPALKSLPNKSDKVKPYVDEPYPITQQMVEERERIEEQRQMAKAKAHMMEVMKLINKSKK